MSEATNENEKVQDVALPDHDTPVKTPAPKDNSDRILSWAEIEEIDDITEEKVYVPQWGGSVVVRSVTHRQMNKLKQQSEEDPDGAPAEEKLQKYMLMHAMVNPSLDSIEKVEVLWGKSSAAVMTILSAVMKTSKLGAKEVKESERQFPEGHK